MTIWTAGYEDRLGGNGNVRVKLYTKPKLVERFIDGNIQIRRGRLQTIVLRTDGGLSISLFLYPKDLETYYTCTIQHKWPTITIGFIIL